MNLPERRTIQIGNAPCSWGTLEFDEGGEQQIGYQQMMDELVETGYSGTELGDEGFMPTEPSTLRMELAQRDLTMLGAFVPVALKAPAAHEEGSKRALRVARLLAAVSDVGDPDHQPFLVLSDANGTDPVRSRNAGRITAEMGLTAAEWDTFARGAEQIARAVRDETGLRTVFHPHGAGYVETPDEIDRFLSMTDPGLLGLVFDTGHYAFGAGDGEAVLPGMKRLADRIHYVHFKDYDPEIAARGRAEGWSYLEAVGNGIFCELGQGSINFPAVLSELQNRRYRGWIVVEQDVLPGMGAPRESARRNRNYLKQLGI